MPRSRERSRLFLLIVFVMSLIGHARRRQRSAVRQSGGAQPNEFVVVRARGAPVQIAARSHPQPRHGARPARRPTSRTSP